MDKERRADDITLDYTNAMASSVGDAHGITDDELGALKEKTAEIHKWLEGLKDSGEQGFFDLPELDTSPIKKFASRVREKYENFVVLGIGGSALGAIAVHDALGHSFPHLLKKRKRNGYPRLFVADNIDPDRFDELLRVLDPKKTIFNVISKSGTTAETMSQFMVVFEKLKQKLKGKWKKRVVITTDAKKGILREMVNDNGLASFEVPDNVGGRFSVLTAVGLVPLACAGIDIDSLLAGASAMAKRTRADGLMKNPSYLFASLLYLADTKKKKNMVVMMPYSSKLYGIADWFRQLWAESVGKRYDMSGKEVYAGSTPIKALGATDQHSQVQLYVEGPFDKVVVFVEIGKFAKNVEIPNAFPKNPSLKYLGGSSLNELIRVEKEGTEYALTGRQRPNMTVKLPELNANTVGQLIFLLETATAFAGGLYAINPFDQPGVEFGKNYAYAVMGREGYGDLKAEIERKNKDVSRRVI